MGLNLIKEWRMFVNRLHRILNMGLNLGRQRCKAFHKRMKPLRGDGREAVFNFAGIRRGGVCIQA
jgi:hypothetical protein